jgi:hypothetical protein
MIPSKISRLVNVKGVYESALWQLENPTPLEGAIALVLMDNALEAAFKLVLDEVDTKPTREIIFPELLNTTLCLEELKELKNCKQSLIVLRGARNGFQHQGIIPDINVVLNEYKPLAEYVLKFISKKKFGLEWEDISLSLLIQDENIRAWIKESEKSFAAEDYVTAAAYLIYTFEAVKSLAQMCIFGSGLLSKRFELTKKYRKDALIEYVTTLDEEIEIFKLGLSYTDFRNYLDVASHVGIDSILYTIPEDTESLFSDYKQKLSTFPDRELLRTWCINMHDFILKFAIRTESNQRVAPKLIGKLLKEFSDGFIKATNY